MQVLDKQELRLERLAKSKPRRNGSVWEHLKVYASEPHGSLISGMRQS